MTQDKVKENTHRALEKPWIKALRGEGVRRAGGEIEYFSLLSQYSTSHLGVSLALVLAHYRQRGRKTNFSQAQTLLELWL